MAAEAGKGDSARPINHTDYSANYDLIFRKKTMQILKFHAEWCPSCKLVGPTLESVVSTTKPEYTITGIDVDKSPEQLQKYDIKNIPVMILLGANGAEVSRFVGNGSETELTAWLNHVPAVYETST